MKDQTNVDTTKTTTCLEWCAGYGGISLGLKRAIPSLRTIAFGEIEAFACANLVAKMEAGLMDAAPIWTDIKTFPCEAFRDRVDILVAGYPCQPFSAAGKRLGTEDPRHLWPYIARSIGIIRPRMCFFENVEGHISLGLREVIGELESIGYKVSWGIFSASEVGAPHQRKRVFILANRKDSDGQFAIRIKSKDSEFSVCSSHGASLANTNHQHGHGEERGWNPEAQGVPSEHWQEEHSRWESGRADAKGHQAWPSRPGEPQHAWEPPRVVANSVIVGRGRRSDGDAGGLCGEIQVEGSCGSGAEEAMGNAASKRSCGGSEDGANQQSEMLGKGYEAMGNAELLGSHYRRIYKGRKDCGKPNGFTEKCEHINQQTQPAMGRDAYGPAGGMDYAELQVSCDNRTDELRLLGNGVVPATATRAFVTLMKELSQ